MKDVVLSVISFVIIVAVFIAFTDYAGAIPDVLFSYSTGECIQVQNYPSILVENTLYTCENLPAKFNHIWVK